MKLDFPNYPVALANALPKYVATKVPIVATVMFVLADALIFLVGVE